MRLTLLVGLMAVLGCGDASKTTAPLGRRIEGFSLRDFRGKAVAWEDFENCPLVVVAFLGTECPLAKLYGARLARLADEFQGRGVAFVGVNSNAQDSVTELAAFARLHEISFPLLKDPGQRVADLFGAERTPEVFVLDRQRFIHYQGRVDNQYGVGYTRSEPTRHDLRLALEDLLAGKQVSCPQTHAEGCFIGRAREAKADAPVTYCGQISRIVQRRCLPCHRPGEIAPISLTNYEEVAGWAEAIGEVVEQGRMPPWHAGPEYGPFIDDRRLPADEKALLLQWVRDGAPQGNVAHGPADVPPAALPPPGWQLPREPDAVFYMSEQPFRVPADGVVDYQYFTVDPGFTEDRWFSAAELVPGNRAVVHHILVFALSPDQARNFKEEDSLRGYLAVFAPGFQSASFPPGMAKRIPAGSKLLFQVHYTPNGSEQWDRSKFGLVFADPGAIEHEVRTLSVVNRYFRIPPRVAAHPVAATSRRIWTKLRLLSLMPHMHLRGKSFRVELMPADGPRETLLAVPRYDFMWQTSYRFAEPRPLLPGTQLHCVGCFDNSAQNLNNPDPAAEVGFGRQNWHDMMICWFDVAIPRCEAMDQEGTPRETLKRKIFLADSLLESCDRNGDGQLSRAEIPKQLESAYEQLDKDQSGSLTRQELEAAADAVPRR